MSHKKHKANVLANVKTEVESTMPEVVEATPTPEPTSDTEPTEAELKAIEAEENNDTPTMVIQLQCQQAEVESKIDTIKASIALEGDAEEKIDAMSVLLELRAKLLTIKGLVEVERFSEVEGLLLEGLADMVEACKDRVTITKLYYEEVEVEVEGVKSTKPMVRINESISSFGKRKASTSSGGSGTTKAKAWTDGTTTITSKELLNMVEAQAPDVVKMIEGTARVAPDRAVKAIKKKKLTSLLWLDSWKSEEEATTVATS